MTYYLLGDFMLTTLLGILKTLMLFKTSYSNNVFKETII